MNWIDSILEMTEEVETPRSYIRWAAYAAISAVVKKNVWFDKHFYKVYPNTYIMLVGPSGITKSYATDIAKKLVKYVNNTKIISGQNSIEGIIEKIGKSQSNEKGEVEKHAHTFIVSNEFTNLLLDNPQAFGLLTELYDSIYNDEWEKTLKSGVVTLKDPCITMITATNVAHFNDKLRSVDIEGGFMGRTMVIVEKDLHRINPLVRKPAKTFNIEVAGIRLKEISKIKGEFKFDNDKTISYYEEWYMDFKENIKDDETGIYKRMADNVFKVAMLDSLAEQDELIFNRVGIEKSIEVCMNLTTNIKSLTAGHGSSADSSKIYRFMQMLINAPEFKVEHTDMLKRNYAHFDVFDLGKIVETLSQAKVIRVDLAGPKRYYVMTDLAVVQYMREKNQ